MAACVGQVVPLKFISSLSVGYTLQYSPIVTLLVPACSVLECNSTLYMSKCV